MISLVRILAMSKVIIANYNDGKFMRIALDKAKRGDITFRNMILRDYGVIETAHTIGILLNDIAAHIEITAIPDFILKCSVKTSIFP